MCLFWYTPTLSQTGSEIDDNYFKIACSTITQDAFNDTVYGSAATNDVIVSGLFVTRTNVTINSSGLAISLSTNASIAISEFDESCVGNLILDWFGDIKFKHKIQSIVQDAHEIAETIQKINVPQTFSSYSSVNMTYSVTQLEFEESDSIELDAKSIVEARNKS